MQSDIEEIQSYNKATQYDNEDMRCDCQEIPIDKDALTPDIKTI